jgi:hypothetical protein
MNVPYMYPHLFKSVSITNDSFTGILLVTVGVSALARMCIPKITYIQFEGFCHKPEVAGSSPAKVIELFS